MSRIHEALKKAAEERNAKSGNGSVSELVDLPSHESPAEALSGNGAVIANAPLKAVVSQQVLPFEAFVKRCTPGSWRIEPSGSVFSAHMDHEVGAEKFRTLRS